MPKAQVEPQFYYEIREGRGTDNAAFSAESLPAKHRRKSKPAGSWHITAIQLVSRHENVSLRLGEVSLKAGHILSHGCLSRRFRSQLETILGYSRRWRVRRGHQSTVPQTTSKCYWQDRAETQVPHSPWGIANGTVWLVISPSYAVFS